MRFASFEVIWFTAMLAVSSTQGIFATRLSIKGSAGNKKHDALEEDALYWSRFLQENMGSVMNPPPATPPTMAPPIAAPTPNPTAAPTPNPTAAPTDRQVAPTDTPSVAPTPPASQSPVVPPIAAPTPNPTAAPTDDQIAPTDTPSVAPTLAFECGGELTSVAIDIVIAVDESVSMTDEQQAVKENIETLFNTIALATNGVFRIALVGYTGPSRTNSNGNAIGPVEVDPELKTTLTNDQVEFEDAVERLTTFKRNRENTRGTLLTIAQNQVQDITGAVIPLAGTDPFPSQQGFCALAITDEPNQEYSDFPDPGNVAVIEEYAKTGSVIFMVAPRRANGLRSLALATGGSFRNTGSFVSNPGPTIASIVETCVLTLCNETIAPTASP